MELPHLGALLAAAAVLSAAAILLLARFASVLGLIDTPGGRKAHSRSVPLVGGLAIFIALLFTTWGLQRSPSAGWFVVALATVVALGLWDDVTEISPRLKLAIQAAASAIMIWGAGVQLHSVGDLIGWRAIGLSVLAIPLTIFAVVGVVNAMNMVDGVDGLAGSLALAGFGWFALVAAQSGLDGKAETALIMCGATAGFLIFNLRFPWQKQARVFLGDAGSLMLGFALGWFAIDLTQGPGRTFPPIAAVWILLLPLADCVSLMIRRLRLGKSPFVADRGHIHHYLLARGFSHSETLAILVGVSIVFGGIGYFAWLFKVQEAILFYPFFFGFFAYHAWIQREWEKIKRREAGVPPAILEEKDSPAPVV